MPNAQVRPCHARLVGVFGVHLRQGDVRAAVLGPRFQLRQLVDGRLVLKHRPVLHLPRPGITGEPGHFQVEPGAAQRVGRIDLQGDQPGERFERVAKQKPHPLHGAEQVAQHREGTAADVPQEDRRPAGPKHPALDLGGFEMGVDRLVDNNQLAGGLEVVDAVAKRLVAHEVHQGRDAGKESLRVNICAPCAHVRRTDLWPVATDQRSVLRFGCGFAPLGECAGCVQPARLAPVRSAGKCGLIPDGRIAPHAGPSQWAGSRRNGRNIFRARISHVGRNKVAETRAAAAHLGESVQTP